MMWNAVVLAGDRNPRDPVARAGLSPHKASAPVGTRRLVDFPLAALAAVMEQGRIGRIIVAAAPGSAALSAGPWDVIEAGATIADSLTRAFETVGAPLLVTTCDAALLTPDIILDFLETAKNGVELSAGITPYFSAETAPGAPKRAGVALADGVVLGANLFAIATPDPTPVFAALSRLERRRPPAEALLVALSWRLRVPSRSDVERKAAKLTGKTAQLVDLSQPEAGFDVNAALDLMHVRQRWEDWLKAEESAA